MSNPFLLAATSPLSSQLLPLLRSNPQLASQQDSHGYSLLHAAASYNHLDLLRALVNEFHVDINLVDEDGETSLFVAETVEIAKCLVEELDIDYNIHNHEGATAVERIEEDGEYPDVALYLRARHLSVAVGTDHEQDRCSADVKGSSSSSSHPPPLPPGISVDIQTDVVQMLDDEEQRPDPEFKRRIEELAAKDNFNSEKGQRELRELIMDALHGVNVQGSNVREVRRKLD